MRNLQTALLYKWFNEVWNNDDENSIDKLMTHDSTAKGILKTVNRKVPRVLKYFLRILEASFMMLK